jgi:hypothetical protein
MDIVRFLALVRKKNDSATNQIEDRRLFADNRAPLRHATRTRFFARDKLP